MRCGVLDVKLQASAWRLDGLELSVSWFYAKGYLGDGVKNMGVPSLVIQVGVS